MHICGFMTVFCHFFIFFVVAAATCTSPLTCDVVNSCSGSEYCEYVPFADCSSDFSNTQGQNGFSYGFRSATTNFTQYSTFIGSSWESASDGAWWSGCVGAPGNHSATVLRYRPPATIRAPQPAFIQGYFQNYQCAGDGVLAYIRHNDQTIWHGFGTYSTSTQYLDISFTLQVDSILDFELWPNSTSLCDASYLSVKLLAPCQTSCSHVTCPRVGSTCDCSTGWMGTLCDTAILDTPSDQGDSGGSSVSGGAAGGIITLIVLGAIGYYIYYKCCKQPSATDPPRGVVVVVLR